MSNIVILPVRIGVQMTGNAIRTIWEQDIPTSILAIDNGTTDGCGEYLRSLGGPIFITAYRPAKSLSYVWNKALEYVFNVAKQDYALVVNNDVILRPDTYRLLLEDGGPFVTGVSVGKMSECFGENKVNVSAKSLHPDFSCFLIRREVWEKVGRFDETMQLYASDNDLHVRMHRAGIKAYSLALPFYHERSSTIKLANNDLRDAIQAQADKDRARFKEKYGCSPWEHEKYDQLFAEVTHA